ncbi:TPA: recombinase family protein [Bacillus cereus biovar anthracis]|uniref:recombinase family protein n=1 Tax=Bacillus anthracis TaxID=1392 RepID=UPI0001DBFB6F|nr:recombinase family protein [Bacillus cereus]ADK07999.1 putative DNA integration/recombination/invertion protein [Bacillus cereus biovar anthracis str. CI]HDR4491873.1 recombinase family protein [Bacillus cereus biovar anthracis]
MIQVVIYARVSTAEQAEEGYSIDAQLDVVKKRCEQEGRIVVDNYVDRGISGKAMGNRAELQRLLRDAGENKFQEIWVWKTNRLARNHLDLLKIVDELNKNNVGFKSCSEAFDTATPTGKLLMNVLASIGEFERESIVENVKMGMKQRAREGKWNGGIVLGYNTVKIDKTENKTKLEVEEKEAYIVKEIFKLYAEGRGLKAITNLVNKLGYRTKRGNFFTPIAIRTILLNPIYIGKIRYNVRENWSEKRRKGINENPIYTNGNHDPIISLDLWNRVQELYKKKSQKPKRLFDGTFPLTGLIKCPMCGASMVAGRVKRKLKDGNINIIRYYQCGAWRNKGTAACRSNGVRADKIEKQVFKRINQIVLNDKILKDTVSKLNDNTHNKIKPLEEALNITNKKIQNFEKKKSRIFDLYEEGTIAKEVLTSRLEHISNEIQMNFVQKISIEKELKQNTSNPIPVDTVKKLLIRFHHLIGIMEPAKQKLILQLIIDKITINDNRELDSIVIHINEQIEKYILDVEGDGARCGAPSPFGFTIII